MKFQRVIVVFNPRSSRFSKVQKEVLESLRERKGAVIGKFEVEPTNVDENAARLARILADGDLVITAGGDGTATIGLNGVILSGKDVRYAALPYGNLNDTARLLGCRNIKEVFSGVPRKVYPLASEIDGRPWRYATCYFTAGMLATSAEVMDKPSVRKKLQQGNHGTLYSTWVAFSWWRKNRKRQFLPEGASERRPLTENVSVVADAASGPVTDLIAVNGQTMAKILKGMPEIAFQPKYFLASTQRLNGFFKVCRFALRGVVKRIPGEVVEEIKISGKPKNVMVQAEGEYARIEMKEFRVYKSDKPVLMITRRKND